mgnify:CR=1 FL=1|tara:strand:+ start:1820 stop:2383 length:564 start_codon:yes stop_codon:yes gene_type:complete
MKLTARIDYDFRCMESYFHRLFQVLLESQDEEALAPIEAVDAYADESLASFHGVSHLIKPDILINIYSLVDYWLSEVCEYQQKSKKLDLTARDIKGNNDLDARHKYLTKYVRLNLDVVTDSFRRLGQLRIVRNKYIHGGGHVMDNELNKFNNIEGISVSGSLIVIDESFIWSQLDHAKKYLIAGVQT